MTDNQRKILGVMYDMDEVKWFAARSIFYYMKDKPFNRSSDMSSPLRFLVETDFIEEDILSFPRLRVYKITNKGREYCQKNFSVAPALAEPAKPPPEPEPPPAILYRLQTEIIVRHISDSTFGKINICFINGKLDRVHFDFKQPYTREQWRILAAIEAEITAIEKQRDEST